MKRFIAPTVLLAAGMIFVSCGGSDSDSIFGVGGGAVAPLMADASQQDLSGQQPSFQGSLGAGVTSTFPVVSGGNYAIRVDTTDSDDEVTIDLWTDSGRHLRSISRDSGETFLYQHVGETQHVLMLVRPRNPLDSIDVVGIFTQATGGYSQTTVHLNFFVAGKFTGYGDPTFNDLGTTAEKGAFTVEVMRQVNLLYAQTGISFTFEGFAWTGADVAARDPNLVGPDDQTLCSAGETTSNTGFELVDVKGLNSWASLGFPDTDPNLDRAHGLDVFLINHFTQDGTVGLSPRPGILGGNGKDTALACAAFLASNGTLTPRTPSQVATVLAHEIGHFLGLLHTTTFTPNFTAPTGSIDDGLADTPRCTVLTDIDGNGLVGIGDGCQDEGNIMFYQAGSQVTFSAGQGKIMQTMLSIQEH